MIYFIRRKTGRGPIKIGTTICLSERLYQLCVQYECEFKVVGLMEGGPKEEKAAHQRFAHLRLPGLRYRRSEWFRPGKDLMAFIRLESKEKEEIKYALAKRSKITVPDDVMRAARVIATLRDTGIEDVLWTMLRPLIHEAMSLEMLKLAQRGKADETRSDEDSLAGQHTTPVAEVA